MTMPETIRIERGERPWHPAGDVRLIEELNYNDMPLCGVLEQSGSMYLFLCLAGPLESAHLWGYRTLSAEDLAAIAGADGPERLAQIVDELMSGGPIIVAVASDEEGILGTTQVRSIDDKELRTAIDRILREFDGYLDEQRRRAAVIRDVLARSVV